MLHFHVSEKEYVDAAVLKNGLRLQCNIPPNNDDVGLTIITVARLVKQEQQIFILKVITFFMLG